MSCNNFSSSTQTSERPPFVAGPSGSADAVDIVFGDMGQLVVDDVGQLIDIEAAGRDIGGHQDADRAGLEAIQARVRAAWLCCREWRRS